MKYEALCYQYLDDYNTARQLFEKAYEIETKINPEKRASNRLDSLNNLAWVAYLDGDLSRALTYLEQADKLFPEIKDHLRRSVQINLGVVHEALGNYAAAYRFFLEAERHIESDRRAMNETRLFEHLGNLERMWGDKGKAFEFYERSLQAIGKANDHPYNPYNLAYYVEASVRLALLSEEEERYVQAVEKLQEALTIARQLGTRRLIARVLGTLGDLYRARKDMKTALDYHRQALEQVSGFFLRVAEAGILVEIGHDHVALADYRQALTFLQKALSLAGPKPTEELQMRLYLGLALAYEGLGDLISALKFYKLLINSTESVDVRTVPEAKRLRYWSTKHAAYERIVALLVRLDRGRNAFEYSERARAKILFDLLRESRTSANLPVERAYVAKISRIQSQLLKTEDRQQEQDLSLILRKREQSWSDGNLTMEGRAIPVPL